MTGTACEVARELKMVYERKTSRVPTNRPSRRTNKGMQVYRTAGEKWNAVVSSIMDVNRLGRPILIGTRSVAASEELAID